MYFVDRNHIENALSHMEELVTLYNEEKEWTSNLINSLAVARLSHVVIESIIDVGNSMIDGFIMRDPGGYDDIIYIMEDEKVISVEMSNPLKEVIGLRKMIVRDFSNVNTDTIVKVLDQSMDSLLAFPTNVRHYLVHELGPVSAFLPAKEDL